MADAVFDAKAPRDHLADTRQCPQLGREARGQGTGHDDLAQFAFLPGIELTRSSQFAALERRLAAFRQALFPGRHRLPRHAQLPCHFRLRYAARLSAAAFPTP